MVNQIKGLFEARQPRIKQYLQKVKEILKGFDTYTIEHIRRNQNKKADALSKLASMTFEHLTKEVLVEVLVKSPSHADNIIKEIHEGSCGFNMEPHSMVVKVMKQGYYWPSIYMDAAKIVQGCTRCQEQSMEKKVLEKDAIAVRNTWPFSHWGVNILGPLPTALESLKFLDITVEHSTNMGICYANPYTLRGGPSTKLRQRLFKAWQLNIHKKNSSISSKLDRAHICTTSSEDYDEEREIELRLEPARAVTPPLRAASPKVRKRREIVVGFEETQNKGESRVERNSEGGRHLEEASRGNGGADPDNFPALFKGAIGMQKTKRETVTARVACHIIGKGVTKKREKTSDTQSGEKKKEEKVALEKTFILLVSERDHRLKKRSVSDSGTGEITFPPIPNEGSSDPVVIKVYISGR
ncbi:reverse transcriptase domain-containing protein [Tanacetum coccineum]